MRQRLINCDFLNASAFIDNLPNKAKLLYMYMFLNADDRGFVNNTKALVDTLDKNDREFRNEVNLSLLNNDYASALNDLIERGLLYEFCDNHNNKVHLIRHWYFHNKYRKGLWTNYGSFLKQVEICDNKYVYKNKSNENNENEMKLNISEPLNKEKLIQEIEQAHIKSRKEILQELEEDESKRESSFDYMDNFR